MREGDRDDRVPVQHRAHLVEQADRRVQARVVRQVHSRRVVRGVTGWHGRHAEDQRSAVARTVDEPPPVVGVVPVFALTFVVLDMLTDVPVGQAEQISERDVLTNVLSMFGERTALLDADDDGQACPSGGHLLGVDGLEEPQRLHA